MTHAEVAPSDDLSSGGLVSKEPIIQSVARASRILLAAASAPDGVSAKEVAVGFELKLSTAYHLLSTLASEGLLYKDARRRYMIGPRAATIAYAVERDNATPQRYIAMLRKLAQITSETAYLCAWRRGEIRVLETIEGAHAIRVGKITKGSYDNPHARAAGKLLLSFASEAQRKALISGRLKRVTPNTITRAAELGEEFAAIRESGLAFDNEEFVEGVSCVSAPIRSDGHVVAAFSVSAPTSRFRANRAHYVDVVQRIAAEASDASII